jgi:hypothetical protein
MFAEFWRWWTPPARRRAAVAAAVRHFEAGGQRARPDECQVIGRDGRGLVVRVCFGDMIPCPRTWLVAAPNGEMVGELSWEEAERLGELPGM